MFLGRQNKAGGAPKGSTSHAKGGLASRCLWQGLATVAVRLLDKESMV